MEKEFIEYCKDSNIDINELTCENIKAIKNSVEYNSYKLGIVINKFIDEVKGNVKPILIKMIDIINKYI